MKNTLPQPHTMSPAQRGLIVQRVIVDGWTIAAAAAAARLPEPLVAAWVADFRQFGMASLRRRPSKIVAAQYLDRGFVQPTRHGLRALWLVTRWLFALERPFPPSPIRQSRDDRRGGS